MLSFTRFHASARLSQETIAFDADVRWDGRLIGHARNDGGGGMAIFHRAEQAAKADLDAASAFAESFVVDLGEGQTSVCHCLADYLDHLAGEVSFDDQQRRWLKRTMKSKVVYLVGTNVYTMKLCYGGNEARVRDHLVQKVPGAVLLNALSAVDAEQAYLHAVRAQASRA